MNYPKTTVCSIEGCNNPHKAKGLCDKHYQQLRKRKLTKWEVSEKTMTYKSPLSIVKPTPDNCVGCKYRRKIYKSKETICYYGSDNNDVRGGTAESCNKYERSELNIIR